MKYLKLTFLILITSLFLKCTSKPEASIAEGTIKIAVDESLKPIMQAQINAYKLHYPNASIIPIYVSEQKAIELLFKDSVTLIATTRDFNKEEMKFVNSKVPVHQPGRMALDAVAIIANKNYPDSSITFNTLTKLMNVSNSKYKLVFDNGNSSNINYIQDKLKIAKINPDNVYGAGNNLKVIDQIATNSNMLGIIGYNWISDRDDPTSNALRNRIKILSVQSNDTSRFVKPSYANLKNRTYPLDRLIYLQTFKRSWGIEMGFVRFSCSKIGQLVIEKMGLLPYYVIPKEFILNTKTEK